MEIYVFFFNGCYWKFMFFSWMLLEIYGVFHGCYWKYMFCFMDVTGNVCKFMDLLHGCYWNFLEIYVVFNGCYWTFMDFYLMDVTGNLKSWMLLEN